MSMGEALFLRDQTIHDTRCAMGNLLDLMA